MISDSKSYSLLRLTICQELFCTPSHVISVSQKWGKLLELVHDSAKVHN